MTEQHVACIRALAAAAAFLRDIGDSSSELCVLPAAIIRAACTVSLPLCWGVNGAVLSGDSGFTSLDDVRGLLLLLPSDGTMPRVTATFGEPEAWAAGKLASPTLHTSLGLISAIVRGRNMVRGGSRAPCFPLNMSSVIAARGDHIGTGLAISSSVKLLCEC
jgi:hypothetical protein